MSSGDSLFDEDAPSPQVADRKHEPPAGPPHWLLEQLRRSLDARGVSDMDDRRRLVEHLVRREVPSLRHLTTGEAQQLLGNLHRLAPLGSVQPEVSAWDSRGEETWIDRL